MSQYEVIKKIMESKKIDESGKIYHIQSYLLHWLTEEQLKWLWEDEVKEYEEMKAHFDSEVLDVKDYVEKITGNRPDYTSLEEMAEDFAEQGICLWDYPINEVEHIIDNKSNVCLVRFTTLYDGYEYRWCELE